MNQSLQDICTVYGPPSGSDKWLDSLKLGVLRFMPDMRLTYYNPAASSMIGLDGLAMREFPFNYARLDIITEDGKPCSPESLPTYTAIQTGMSAASVILGIRHELTAERIWLEVNAEPIFTPEGTLQEIITSFSDITTHKVAKDQLNSLYQHLEIRALELSAVHADLEKFIYAATHDLQEPLRLITSFLQLLMNKYEPLLDEQAKTYIRFAVEGSDRMKRLILDLLEYSRITGNGKMMLPADMNAVLDVTKQTLSSQLENCSARLLVSQLPVAVVCPPLMAQLFENIIENALQYKSDKDPMIEIGCKDEDDHWLFSVKDNGIGIADGNADRIFNLFHRLQPQTNTNGTGAGLAICRKIVSMHRGRIWVKSEPGAGSIFYFTIPKSLQDNEKV